jgi:hypothetical protein
MLRSVGVSDRSAQDAAGDLTRATLLWLAAAARPWGRQLGNVFDQETSLPVLLVDGMEGQNDAGFRVQFSFFATSIDAKENPRRFDPPER